MDDPEVMGARADVANTGVRVASQMDGHDRYLSTEGQVIFHLCEGPLRAMDIYNRMEVSQPAVSRCLRKMVQQGTVLLGFDDGDFRVRVYSLNEHSPVVAEIRAVAKKLRDALPERT